MSEKYFKEKEAAKELGVSPKALQNWRAKGINLAYFKSGKNIVYLKSDIEAFLAKQRVLPTRVMAIKRRSTIINMAKMPLEQLIALSTEKLVELETEADDALKEVQGVKDWIGGVIAIRNSINGSTANQQIIFGGENAQITDY